MIHTSNLFPFNFIASDLDNIVVVAGPDSEPGADGEVDHYTLEDYWLPFGTFKGDVDDNTIVKIRPVGRRLDESVAGKYVVIYVPGEAQLSIAEVKIYVKPSPDLENDDDDTGAGDIDGGGDTGAGDDDGAGGDDGDNETLGKKQPQECSRIYIITKI